MQKGFTIIEVLTVVIIVGLLASIAVVSYNGVQNQARDSSVQSDLDSIAGELEAYRVRSNPDNPNNQFPTTETVLQTLEIQAAKSTYDTTINNNMIYCVTTTGSDAHQRFSLIARSKSGAIFMMTEEGFKDQSFTADDLSSSICSTLGMTHISSGMYAPDAWRAWVKNY